VSAAPDERLPFGRALVDGAPRDCLFDGDTVRLLDRPAYERGAHEAGVAALAGVRLLAPVRPVKVVAVGLNYRAHAAELAMETKAEHQVDYEAELVLVVGQRCRAVTPASAASFVAGYTCGNDVTARDLQKLDGQWTRAKSFDTFCPLGPWVVREAPPAEAAVTTAIDGEEVQRGRVGDMIVAPLELLSFVSGIMTLEPGDVIMTGTPPGVGPLAAGQVVTVAVEGVGSLSNQVAAGA
jgi:2-keto-4-pentenoate hydratase/2-oxohepta-3-ene-1,7-dioic acid hydratase in catechol pathway